MIFQFNPKGFEQLTKQLNPKIVIKATVRTLNDEGRRFRTEIVKVVREDYNIKASELKRYIKTDTASRGLIEFKVDISSKRLSLSKFGAKERIVKVNVRRQNKKTKRTYTVKEDRNAVTVKVLLKSKRKLLKRGFIFNKQLFQRNGDSRLSISKLTTLSAPQMFKNDTIEDGYELVEKHLHKTFERHYAYYISKVK